MDRNCSELTAENTKLGLGKSSFHQFHATGSQPLAGAATQKLRVCISLKGVNFPFSKEVGKKQHLHSQKLT